MRKQTFHRKKLILVSKWNSLGIQPTMDICVMGLKARPSATKWRECGPLNQAVSICPQSNGGELDGSKFVF